MPGAKQVAAVVLRRKKNSREVLLITSRDTKRWILPKGWIEDEEHPTEAAEREAWEEAGVRGKAITTALGSYEYVKVRPQRGDLLCHVDIFQLDLKEQKRRWPEMRERNRKWVPLSAALHTIEEPALVRALAGSALFKSET